MTAFGGVTCASAATELLAAGCGDSMAFGGAASAGATGTLTSLGNSTVGSGIGISMLRAIGLGGGCGLIVPVVFNYNGAGKQHGQPDQCCNQHCMKSAGEQQTLCVRAAGQ